jgi:hypothetical protein
VLRRVNTHQMDQNIGVEQTIGHQSYIESRRVASGGRAGLGGRLAIHSRSQATRWAGVVDPHHSSAVEGSRRNMTTSPCASTVKRAPGGARPGGTTSAPVSSAWMVWLISLLFYRREVRRGLAD